jgi:hypothetical protein
MIFPLIILAIFVIAMLAWGLSEAAHQADEAIARMPELHDEDWLWPPRDER